tara:strand:+ start:1126 stop:1626 length:501 start_codon:yes stop_codon:yes gene_type:complete
MSKDYEVIDNFLPEEDFEHIRKVIMGKQFPWHFLEDVAEKGVVQNEVPHFYLYHMLFEFWRPGSNFFSLMEPILLKLKPRALVRIKLNLYQCTTKRLVHGQHRDFDWEHKGGLFSLNTCDGATILEDGTEIESIANRMLVFNPNKLHSSTTTTNKPARFNININYF